MPRTGLPAGIPQEALDTAGTVRLCGAGREPVEPRGTYGVTHLGELQRQPMPWRWA